MYAYIVLSLLCGVRTEEARALHWQHVDLDGDLAASPPVPPHVAVGRSVRVHGETKTERSRRTLGLPQMTVEALRGLLDSQADERLLAGERWQDTGLVFTTHLGTALHAGNVRKMFKRVCTAAGIGDAWTPRELRTSFVSLLSHHGVSIEEIARLAGHASTRTTEVVYRRELRPVITTGAEIMDEVFGEASRAPACSVNVRTCPNRGREGGEFRRGWCGRAGLRGRAGSRRLAPSPAETSQLELPSLLRTPDFWRRWALGSAAGVVR